MDMCVLDFVFVFFKQKTAYEMRISDWSSDVCSSDLSGHSKTVVPALVAGTQYLRPARAGRQDTRTRGRRGSKGKTASPRGHAHGPRGQAPGRQRCLWRQPGEMFESSRAWA